jgi:hypothetical protein
MKLEAKLRVIARNPKYAARWGIAITAVQAPCRHLGKDTGQLVPCGDGKGCRKKVFACAIHGKCTARKVAGLASCDDCDERQPA